MRDHSFFFGAFILVALVFEAHLPAQNAANGVASSGSGAAARSSYLAAPLDLNLRSLGLNFRGHDIRAVVAAVAKGVRERSEFETTAAYNARLEAFPTTTIYGQLTADSDLAFVSDSVDSAYDADHQVLNINLGTFPSVLIRDSWQRRGHYVGTNGFGASVTVLKSDRYSYYLDFLDEWLFQSPTYGIKMTAAEAAGFKRDGRLVFVCRLSKPWISQSSENYEPTFTAPVEGVAEEDHLYVIAEQLWVYQARTGAVLHKFVGETIDRDRPLSLEVSFPLSGVRYSVGIDGGEEHSDWVRGETRKFVANNKIVLRIENYGLPLEGMTLKLNGKPYLAKWAPDFVTPGGVVWPTTEISRTQ